MKRFRFLVIYFLCFHFCLCAQDDGLTVLSFTQELTDLSARRNPEYDMDGDYCALIKVQVLTEDHISFQGSYIKGEVQKHINEYWAYMGKGAKIIDISHPRYISLRVSFKDVSNGEIPMLESGVTYKLVIAVPEQNVDTVMIAETFDAKLEEARKMYHAYSSHSDSEYYRKAAGLYDAAMKHTDCPSAMLQSLQKEYDTMRFMRKYTFLYEKANRIALEKEKELGYNSDSVYHYLQLAYKATLKLTQQFPQATSFKTISERALEKLKKHPKGTVQQTMVATKKRPSAYGSVSLKKSSQALNTIAIYACKTEKPTSKDERKLLGFVKKDGSYEVILPPDYEYIIFDGEKKSHHILSMKTELNVTL